MAPELARPAQLPPLFTTGISQPSGRKYMRATMQCKPAAKLANPRAHMLLHANGPLGTSLSGL